MNFRLQCSTPTKQTKKGGFMVEGTPWVLNPVRFTSKANHNDYHYQQHVLICFNTCKGTKLFKGIRTIDIQVYRH